MYDREQEAIVTGAFPIYSSTHVVRECPQFQYRPVFKADGTGTAELVKCLQRGNSMENWPAMDAEWLTLSNAKMSFA